MVLGDVTETVYVVDDEDGDNVRTVKKQSEMLFVRGRCQFSSSMGDEQRMMDITHTHADPSVRRLGRSDIAAAMRNMIGALRFRESFITGGGVV